MAPRRNPSTVQQHYSQDCIDNNNYQTPAGYTNSAQPQLPLSLTTTSNFENFYSTNPVVDLNFMDHKNYINTSIMTTSSENYVQCCVPTGECLKSNSTSEINLISLDNLCDCIRVLCNNEQCTAGQYMHRECFESWEQTVLNALKQIGRARSWSDRQRAQNLWTKKGYDLVYKACGCKCNRGHLKKDLDWQPPSPIQQNGNIYGRNGGQDEESNKKKKKRNRQNQKPTLAISSLNGNIYHPNSGVKHPTTPPQTQNMELLRGRAGSLSSSSGSTSPPVSSEHSISPVHLGLMQSPGVKIQQQQQHQLILHQQQAASQLAKTKVEIYSERVRSTSGCNGIFSRRIDFSSFNQLPKTRLNSYQVKMEDEGNHGNDDTRLFILSSLAQNQRSKVTCILCEEAMLVFDRYPLVDGSFFLSPRQHSPACIEVKYEGRSQYLTAVCMACLDNNSSNRAIFCRFCHQRWNGTSLVLGTMYSYDIFAAMPCCSERLKCNACFKILLHPTQRLNFYSDYSHYINCPYCSTQDIHFVKPLAYCFTQTPTQNGVQLP